MNHLLFGLTILVFSLSSRADYFSYQFLNKPIVRFGPDAGYKRVELNEMCPLLKYDYVSEKMQMEQIRKNLIDLSQQDLTPDRVQLIDSLKNQLHEKLSRLTYLSGAQWNTEMLSFSVRWRLSEIDPTFFTVRKFDVTSVRYLNEQNGSLLNFLRFGRDYTIDKKVPYYFIEYAKRGTYLELCQFVKTLSFEVNLGIQNPLLSSDLLYDPDLVYQQHILLPQSLLLTVEN